MIKLIKNEYIKIGYIKLLLPFLILNIYIIIKNLINKSFTNINLFNMIPFVGIVICIVFCGIISNEIETGTLKYYLTKSKSRSKIYLSKLLAIFIYILSLMTSILIIYFIINKNFEFKIITKYFVYMFPVYLIASLAIMLSVIIKYTPINLGLCIIFLTFGGLLSEFLFKNKITFIEYSILPYLDFNIFLSKESIELINLEYEINLNIRYAITINILCIILFNVIGYLLFIKKDINS